MPYQEHAVSVSFLFLRKIICCTCTVDQRTSHDDCPNNVIAEYTWNGTTEAPAKQYVNGTQYIDERAVMRDVAGGGKDHYYLLKDLYSVAGLAAAHGRLEEAYVYDTYGEAVIEGRSVGQGPDDGGWPKGDLVVTHPIYRQPIKIKFPRPAYKQHR